MNVASIAGNVGATALEALRPPASAGQEGPFARIIDQALAQATGPQAQADQAVRDLAMGQTDNLHGVLLSVAQADMTFRLILEIRNRLTEAYQEIMRMQV